jgi:hypothetical protein
MQLPRSCLMSCQSNCSDSYADRHCLVSYRGESKRNRIYMPYRLLVWRQLTALPQSSIPFVRSLTLPYSDILICGSAPPSKYPSSTVRLRSYTRAILVRGNTPPSKYILRMVACASLLRISLSVVACSAAPPSKYSPLLSSSVR